MTDTSKPGPNSEEEQPDEAQDQAESKPPPSEKSSDEQFAPVNQQDFIATFKNLLNQAESDSQPQTIGPPAEFGVISSSNTHLEKHEIAAGQLEERVLHGGQIRQVVDRVTGIVTTTIATGAIDVIIHRPGMPPEIKVRDPSTPAPVRVAAETLAVAEARGQGKTVTIFSDGRVEVRPDLTIAKEDSVEARAKLIIEYPPHHASGLVGRTEYEENPEGKTILFITRDGGGDVTETTTYLGRTDGIILTSKKTTIDGRTISTQVHANGTKVIADDRGLHIEEAEETMDETEPVLLDSSYQSFAYEPSADDREDKSLEYQEQSETLETLQEACALEFNGDVLESLLGTDEAMKLAAALALLSDANQEEVLRWMALDFVTQLQSSRTKESREAAQSILNKLSKNDAKIALNRLAQHMPVRSTTEGGAASRKALNAVPVLFSKLRDNPEAEANVCRLVPYILQLNDKNLTRTIRRHLDRTGAECELSSLQSETDARIEPMKELITCSDSSFKLNAAIALCDVNAKGVERQVSEAARKVVYQCLDGMIEHALRLDNQQIDDGHEAWKRIDTVLARIGESEDGYGKNYVSSRRLELEGGRIQGDF